MGDWVTIQNLDNSPFTSADAFGVEMKDGIRITRGDSGASKEFPTGTWPYAGGTTNPGSATKNYGPFYHDPFSSSTSDGFATSESNRMHYGWMWKGAGYSGDMGKGAVYGDGASNSYTWAWYGRSQTSCRSTTSAEASDGESMISIQRNAT